MKRLVLLRHGQSQWNLENRFTGWYDVDLSDQGREEAARAGILMREAAIRFDAAFTSVLKRAIRTLWMSLDAMDQMYVPITNSWRLNERHYGALTGLNKAETAQRYGEEQVHTWRRSYATQPPALDDSDERHPRHDPRYRHIDPDWLPATESLETTLQRVLPYWNSDISPSLQSAESILVAAHGNSLRALVKHLRGLDNDEITRLEIPTGEPLVFELDTALGVTDSYYLRDRA